MEPFTLHGLVEAFSDRTPDAPAVRMKDQLLSYRELSERARRIAAHLVSQGVEPGDRVGLYQPKSIDGVAAMIGILGAGAAYVPVDPGAPVDRARFILEHCGVRVVFSFGRQLAELQKAEPFVDTIITAETSLPEPGDLLEGTDQDLAYVLYTSGSTGTPKGVAITHGQSLAFVRATTDVFALAPSDVLNSHAPFNFDLSIIDLFCAFAAGASVVLIPESHLAFPLKISEVIEKAKITVWNSVPSALVQLVNKGALESRELSALRLIMFAGEPFPLKHLAKLRELIPHAELLNIYGQTEANSSTYYRVDEIPSEVLPIGKTFSNYGVLLLDEAGDEVAEPNREGELHVIGGAVASGYWNDPERTAKAFVQHPLMSERRQILYKTGDRMIYDERGDLVFRGRMDAAIKCRGFRVELGEIESVASRVDAIDTVCVVPVPHEEMSNLLVMFVVPEKGKTVDENALKELLAAKLPRYMLPEKIVQRAELPSTGTGKIDRRALAPAAADALSPGLEKR